MQKPALHGMEGRFISSHNAMQYMCNPRQSCSNDIERLKYEHRTPIFNNGLFYLQDHSRNVYPECATDLLAILYT